MAQVSFTQGKSAYASVFTFSGKRRPLPTPAWLRSAAAILILIAPAAAQPQIGPTSSTSVNISASVAAKYGLRANGAAIRSLERGAGGFCMTTNGRPTDLPVRLVRHTSDEMAAGRMPEEGAVQLSWCAAGKWAIDATRNCEPNDCNTFLIVRPE